MKDKEQLLQELSTLKQRLQEIEQQLGSDGGAPASREGNAGQSDAAAKAGKAAIEAVAAPQPESVAMDTTRIVMHQIVAPTEVDALGICFGGQVLSWIDVCAGLSAKTLARGPCVTISVDAVHFFRPCCRGDVVIIAAMVNRTFSSSMEVGVRVEAENMRTGARRHCCSAYLTFVSLNSRQQKTKQQIKPAPPQPQPPPAAAAAAAVTTEPKQQRLPRVHPSSSEHSRIYSQAEARRQQRLAARQAAVSDPERAAAAAACRLKPVTHREGCPTLPPALTLHYSPSSSSSSCIADLVPTSSAATAPLHSSRSSSIDIAAADEPAEQPQSSNSGPAAASSSRLSQQQADSAAGGVSMAAVAVRRRVPPSATTAYMTQSIMPQHANTLGITFGGQVMSWMEQCAYISASRLRGAHLLTAGMDSVTFAQSTKVGDIIYITAQVSAIFGSSLEVMISVFGECPLEGRVFHCADAFATLVVVDLDGKPCTIPFQLEPATAAEKLRFEGAQRRRTERLAMRSAMAAVHSMRLGLDGSCPLAVETAATGAPAEEAPEAEACSADCAQRMSSSPFCQVDGLSR